MLLGSIEKLREMFISLKVEVHMKNYYSCLFSLLLFGLLSCKSINLDAKKQIKETVISFKQKEITREVYNQDKSMLLILKYTTLKSWPITFNYLVKDVRTSKELKKGTFSGEKIEWFNTLSLKCYHHIGMVKKDNNQELLNEMSKQKTYSIIKIK